MTTGENPTAADDLSAWDAALEGAFQVLLGKNSAEDSGAVYGVYYADDSVDEFLFPNEWATPEALADGDPRPLPYPGADEYPFSPGKWRFDFSESLFHFDSELLAGSGPWGESGHKGPRPFGGEFVADIRAAAIKGTDEVLVRGADLGPVLARHGVDLTNKRSKKLNSWLTVLLRVSTDGTLNDAMRAATFTAQGPEHLAPFDDEGYVEAAEESWEEALAAVAHPALRDHLRMLCLDEENSRSAGAHYCGAEWWPFITDVLGDIGYSLMAGWQFGESQAGSVVVRLPGHGS